MNIEQFKIKEACAVGLRDWCGFVTRHPEQFSEQDRDEAFFTGRWMWSLHVLHESPLIPPTPAEAMVGYIGSTYQVRKCPLAATVEVWHVVYFADSKRSDLEIQVGDYQSIEAAIEANQIMYHEALAGVAHPSSMALAA